MRPYCQACGNTGSAPEVARLDEHPTRRTPHRPERQDPAPRGRPPARRVGPPGDRPLRRARAVTEHVHTCGSPRSACGTPAPPVTTRSRSSTRSSLLALRRPARPPRRRRRHDGPLRTAHPREGGFADSPRNPARPPQHRPPGPRGGPAPQEDQALMGERIDDLAVVVHRASAAASSRSCSRSAGLRRTWPATSTRRPIPSPWRTTAGTCGLSGAGRRRLLARWLRRCRPPCGAGKTSSARGRWPRRRRPP